MDSALIEVHELNKRYRQVKVLRGASLRARRGEIVGVVGENGAGKSTLLQIAAGLLRADSGTVSLLGTFGYCPQDPVLFENLSIEQNLAYFAAAHGLAREVAERRSAALMERLNCQRYRGRPVARLSGGTQQKLNLIIALLHEPDVLLLDEPYQGLDYGAYLAFWELADEMAAAGRSVLLVSHLVHDRSRVSRLYRLADGKTIDA